MALVLIVDDDAAFREGLAETLADLGHQATEAADGLAGLARLARGGVDAMLLDLRMPGLDGLEVLRRIRARPCKIVEGWRSRGRVRAYGTRVSWWRRWCGG